MVLNMWKGFWVLANGNSHTVVSLQRILTSYADYYYSIMIADEGCL